MAGLTDILVGLRRWRLWSMLALDEWRLRTYKTLLGPIWLSISFVVFIGVKLLIFPNLTDVDTGYFSAHLVLGFMAWQFLTELLAGGSATFTRARNWILGIKAPYSVFVYSALLQSLMTLMFAAVPAYVIAYMMYPFSWQQFALSILGMAYVVLGAFWIFFLLATLSVFVRDVIQLTQTVMRVFFFLTPILWIPPQSGSLSNLVVYNPFVYYLNMVRLPILEGGYDQRSIIIVGAITLAMMASTCVCFSLARRRITAFL